MKINLYFKSVALLGMLAFLSCSKDKQSGQTAIQNDGPVTLKSGIVVEKKELSISGNATFFSARNSSTTSTNMVSYWLRSLTILGPRETCIPFTMCPL